jgi:hypothetical protein
VLPFAKPLNAVKNHDRRWSQKQKRFGPTAKELASVAAPGREKLTHPEYVTRLSGNSFTFAADY